jgi:hypothetical protein
MARQIMRLTCDGRAMSSKLLAVLGSSRVVKNGRAVVDKRLNEVTLSTSVFRLPSGGRVERGFRGTARCGKSLPILGFQMVQGAAESVVGGGCQWHSRGARFAAELVLGNTRKSQGNFVRIAHRGVAPLATRMRRSWRCCSPLKVELPRGCSVSGCLGLVVDDVTGGLV